MYLAKSTKPFFVNHLYKEKMIYVGTVGFINVTFWVTLYFLLKMIVVTPGHRKEDSLDKTNCTSFSILLLLSRVFEKVLIVKLTNALSLP